MDTSSIQTPQNEFAAIVKVAQRSDPQVPPRIDFLYLRYVQDQPDAESLAEVVCSQVINYAVPKKKMMLAGVKAAAGDGSFMARLQSEARRAFIEYINHADPDKKRAMETRYSEVGEVIAFCVACSHLNAGQVVGKMALKTSSEMPVFGLDGIHAMGDQNGELNVFFLESKMVNDVLEGLSQYLDSAKSFYGSRKKYLNELRICRDLSNLDLLEGEARGYPKTWFINIKEQARWR